MFDRALQVKMIKNAKSRVQGETDTPEADFEGRAIIIAETVERGIRKICFVVCTYVVLDTLRQVAIACANKE